ncbi:YcaO-like family protein [Pseudomonas sp. GX19020]|uniref:YcaO-like family protein n=1 Tax=Pseudomonas sp. GX19020 TaxID=2942277 RepID=UPI0020188570|nr:YcaO-like family protein [Pseudomonas sp. GX19020]MCL4069409.1 YcaO-like family protein [Pseudomonas sp. GX19020]
MDHRSAIDESNERTRTREDAIQRARNLMSRIGLKFECRVFGDYAKTVSCAITDRYGFSTEGHGKGIGNQSFTSAIYEALEHYYYFTEDIQGAISSVELDFSGNGSYLIGGSPPVERMFTTLQPIPLSCVQFESILHPKIFVDFPMALLNPYYEAPSEAERKAIRSSGLYRYATNSGTASGATRDEALLHAMLELIERDSLGIFITNCSLRKSALPVRVVSTASLNERILEVLRNISEQAKAHVEVFNITSSTGVPTFLCSLESDEPKQFRFFGSGSSCLPEYALERAVLEAFQGFCLQFKFGKEIQPTPILNTSSNPFQRMRLEHGHLYAKGGYAMEDFDGSQRTELSSIPKLHCSEQVIRLALQLAKQNIHFYSRDIFEGEVSVVQVISPQLERFYLMTKGMPVAPGGRAKAAYEN